jgi:outer membrane receptor protein involved in Fe transport
MPDCSLSRPRAVARTGAIRALIVCALILWGLAGSAARAAAPAASTQAPTPAANPATAQELPQVVVIANAPLAGLGLPANEIPANVQTADSRQMQRQQSLDLADYLNNSFSGVSASASAANPFQMDVNYHGFTASPLLGTPEGLSVYVDGVRVNESFGDTVNWDLIPQSAISTVTLMSGSNPVFGLNTLGGALLVRTKSGHDNPGTELEAIGGSFGRRSFAGETGGEFGNFDYFLTTSFFDETGWRDLSASRVWQGFAKAGWQNDRTDIDLSYSYADTSLDGNGATPQSMLAYRRRASYTPDFTANVLHFVNLTGTQFLTGTLLLSGNIYYRQLTTRSGNANVNDGYLSDSYSGPPLDCTAPPGSATDLAYCSPGQSATGRLTQSTTGFAVQLTDSRQLFGRPNQAVVGADYSHSTDGFAQSSQLGTLAPDRTLIYAASPFNDQTVISLAGANRIYGGYLTDTLSTSRLLHLTASIRYNRNTETLDGYSLNTALGPGFGQSNPLAGRHTFSRLNPAIGFTLTPSEAWTLYANYNEASRAPTVIELGCANPTTPCGLPNAFAGDPNLSQVVARTAELGTRGTLARGRVLWSADVFHTINTDDIQFVATATNAGYFANFGSTRREGLDLALGGRLGGLDWRVAYSLVAATFDSAFEVSSPSNSTADPAGNIRVHAGDRIPLIPRNTGRLLLDYALGTHWSLGGSAIAVSGSYLHGNENNLNQAGATNASGAYIAGSGWIAGYAVVNLHAGYTIGKHAEIFVRLVNLFDREYSTAGFLTRNAFTARGSFIADPANWTNENALSPAEPRALWAGVRIRLK